MVLYTFVYMIGYTFLVFAVLGGGGIGNLAGNKSGPGKEIRPQSLRRTHPLAYTVHASSVHSPRSLTVRLPSFAFWG